MTVIRNRPLAAALFVGALVGVGVPMQGAIIGQSGSATTVAQTECPNSMTESIYIVGCLPGVDPAPELVDERGPDELPTLRGIPCAGSDCLGLNRALEDNSTPDRPDTEVRSNP